MKTSLWCSSQKSLFILAAQLCALVFLGSCSAETKLKGSKTSQKNGPAEPFKGDPLSTPGVFPVSCQNLFSGKGMGAPKNTNILAIPFNCPLMVSSQNPVKSIFASVALDIGPNMQTGEVSAAFKTSVESICTIGINSQLPITWKLTTFDDTVIKIGEEIDLCEASARETLPFKKKITKVSADTPISELNNQIINAGFEAIGEASKQIQGSALSGSSVLKIVWYVTNTTSAGKMDLAAPFLRKAREDSAANDGMFVLLASVQDGVLKELPSTYPKPSRQWEVFVSSTGTNSTLFSFPISPEQQADFSEQIKRKNFKQKACLLTGWKSFDDAGKPFVERTITGETPTSGYETIALSSGLQSIEIGSSCAEYVKTSSVY
jgi:hypothetical protein